MTSYVDWVVESEVSESTGSAEFLEQQVQDTKAEADVACDRSPELHPRATLAADDPKAASQTSASRCSGCRRSTGAELIAARAGARQPVTRPIWRPRQAKTVVQQRLQTVDEPEIPAAPQPRLRKAIFTMFLFAAVERSCRWRWS